MTRSSVTMVHEPSLWTRFTPCTHAERHTQVPFEALKRTVRQTSSDRKVNNLHRIQPLLSSPRSSNSSHSSLGSVSSLDLSSPGSVKRPCLEKTWDSTSSLDTVSSTGLGSFECNTVHNKRTGDVFVVGASDVGQLGLGEEVLQRRKWAKLAAGLPDPIVDVVCGGSHTLLLTDTNAVYSFGNNDDGALGREGDETIPHRVDSLPRQHKVVKMAASDNANLVLYEHGQVWGWGGFRGSNGVLPNRWLRRRSALLSLGVDGDWPVDIAAGNNHFLILMASSAVLVVGMNCHGQLGVSAATRPFVSFPICTNIPRGVAKIARVACGGYHSFFITTSGELYACGSHSYGQLGIGPLMEQTRRTVHWRRVLLAARNEKIKSVAGGEHHSVVLTTSGRVFAAGRNSDGQCGLPATLEYTLAFKEVTVPERIEHVVVGLGAAHSYLIGQSGLLYTFGYGPSGQLGLFSDSKEDHVTVFQPTLVPLKGRKTRMIAAGGQHSVALLTTRE